MSEGHRMTYAWKGTCWRGVWRRTLQEGHVRGEHDDLRLKRGMSEGSRTTYAWRGACQRGVCKRLLPTPLNAAPDQESSLQLSVQLYPHHSNPVQRSDAPAETENLNRKRPCKKYKNACILISTKSSFVYIVNISKLLNCSFPNINEKCYVCLVTSFKH